MEWAILIKIATAIGILVGGWIVATLVKRLIKLMFRIKKVDPTVGLFLGRTAYTVVLIFALVAALAKLGVQTASLVAVVGAVGLAISLSLKSTLSNVASGLFLVVFRPFRVGESIEAAGIKGKVEEVQLMFTKLRTPENDLIYVPNNKLTSNNIVNRSHSPLCRGEMLMGIDYDDDLDKAKALLLKLLTKDKRIEQDPKPVVVVKGLGSSTIDVLMRFWVDHGHLSAVQYDLNEQVKTAFDKAGFAVYSHRKA